NSQSCSQVENGDTCQSCEASPLQYHFSETSLGDEDIEQHHSRKGNRVFLTEHADKKRGRRERRLSLAKENPRNKKKQRCKQFTAPYEPNNRLGMYWMHKINRACSACGCRGLKNASQYDEHKDAIDGVQQHVRQAVSARPLTP